MFNAQGSKLDNPRDVSLQRGVIGLLSVPQSTEQLSSSSLITSQRLPLIQKIVHHSQVSCLLDNRRRIGGEAVFLPAMARCSISPIEECEQPEGSTALPFHECGVLAMVLRQDRMLKSRANLFSRFSQ
jgi:hypothetical protein